MNLINFLENTLAGEIRSIQNYGHHYLSFSLISQSIELLGALIDEFDIDEDFKSKARFNNAIKSLFIQKYHPYADDSNDYNLYKNLRCGVLHICVPKRKIEFSERNEPRVKSFEFKHLNKYKFRTETEERLLLVAEDFHEDFTYAVQKIVTLIKNNTLFSTFPSLHNASQSKKEILTLQKQFLRTSL
jgi:hypothetical protein